MNKLCLPGYDAWKAGAPTGDHSLHVFDVDLNRRAIEAATEQARREVEDDLRAGLDPLRDIDF